MIQINSTYLPAREELNKYTDTIYRNRVVTNNGPLVQKFEHELRKLMHVNHLLYVSSGHTAIMMALNTLPIKGKVIPSAFSFISSLNARSGMGSNLFLLI